MDSADVIGARYRLDRKIGQGGIGRIWLAQDTRLDRRVAIKFLLANTPYQRVRYGRRVALEAKIAASVQHRNVVQIFDFGTHENDTPYIVMEALSGFTLGEAFDSVQKFSLDALIHVMAEVLRGLTAVHEAGIVHRDLKPENIFLIKEPHDKYSPKLLDFGISRSLEPDTRRSAVTTTEGMILGTPQYMSPEQASGDVHIDKRTDIYSVGVIMFEAFAGVIPFPANNVAELLIAVIQQDAPPLFELVPQIGRPLCEVVDRALKNTRDQRYADAAEMLDALLAATQHIPAELDRKALIFPPDAIKNRACFKPGDAAEDASVRPADPNNLGAAAPTPATVYAPSVRPRGRRTPRNGNDGSRAGSVPPTAATLALPVTPIAGTFAPPNPSRTTLALGAVAVLSLTVAVATVLVLRDRGAGSESSGMIVVQAPAPPPLAPAPAPAPEPEKPAEVQAEPAVSAAPAESPRSKSNRKGAARKQTVTPDPMPALATSVAEAFSKQKAKVISCISEHPGDIEGSPELTVRVLIDEAGKVRQAELLPEAVSTKPVSACVKAAVTAMSFPKPGQLTTFRSPLLWRRK